VRQIQLVNQINDKSCVHACIAMVTGNSVKEMWERYPHPMENTHQLVLLIERKILPIPTALAQLGVYFPSIGIYFMSVPSLNVPGALHCVVVKAEVDRFTVYDPQAGREGKKFYPSDCLMSDSADPIKSYCEVFMLDFDVLRDLRIGGDA